MLIQWKISCYFVGKTFEKAGVNVSVLWGDLSEQQIAPMKKRGKDLRDGKNSFFATGIGITLFYVFPWKRIRVWLIFNVASIMELQLQVITVIKWRVRRSY